MAICRACSSEIIGSDRYCRNCGVPVAPVVAEFDDTRRFNPSAPLPAGPGTPDFREAAEARRARDEMNDEIVRREYEIAVQNALGFKQGVYSATEFPGVQGIFINNLMSDNSPAALAKIQAGDLMTELNDQQVRNDSELSQVLKSLETGQEVPVKVSRDGATVSTRIKIADRAFPAPQPKIEPRDQGFL